MEERALVIIRRNTINNVQITSSLDLEVICTSLEIMFNVAFGMDFLNLNINKINNKFLYSAFHNNVSMRFTINALTVLWYDYANF